MTDPADTLYQGSALGDEWVSLGFVNHDLTLFKNFAIGGGRNLQVRFEMYNAFNTTQYQAVDTGAQFNYTTGEQTRHELRSGHRRARQFVPRDSVRRALHVLRTRTRSKNEDTEKT